MIEERANLLGREIGGMFTSHWKSLKDHEARIKALEEANETKVSLIRVEPNMTEFQFTQADLDAARQESMQRCIDEMAQVWRRKSEG